MPAAKLVHYSGTVQGVGFRYTAARVARSYKITGYVKNLPSGQVELMAEGEPAEIERFLAEIARQMAGYIAEQSVQDQAPQGFDRFEIRT